MAELSVEADLDFTMTVPAGRAHGSRTVSGRLSGSGAHLELHVSDPRVFAGRADSGVVRGLADAMARRGLSVTVVAPGGPLVTLGTARTSWLQRRLTGSRHIRVAGPGAAWSLARSRGHGPVLPGNELAPPATLLPLAPTFLRKSRFPVTTTHDPEQGGSPRLVLPPREEWPAAPRRVLSLSPGVTTLGSAADCDVVLDGLAPYHAEVRHDSEDEFVVVRLGAPGSVRVNGEPVAARILRTGSRLDLGPWTLTYYREEYADHGRPYGGRLGGEVGHQRPQPPRRVPATRDTDPVPSSPTRKAP